MSTIHILNLKVMTCFFDPTDQKLSEKVRVDRDRQTVLWPAGWNVRLQGEQSSRGAEEGVEAQRDQGEAEPDSQRESHEPARQGGRAGILYNIHCTALVYTSYYQWIRGLKINQFTLGLVVESPET